MTLDKALNTQCTSGTLIGFQETKQDYTRSRILIPIDFGDPNHVKGIQSGITLDKTPFTCLGPRLIMFPSLTRTPADMSIAST